MTKMPFILRPVAILVFSAAVICCSKDDDSTSACDPGSDPVCDVCNPAENLHWLRKKIAELEKHDMGRQVIFYSGRFKNMTVIAQGMCCVDCNPAAVFWTCDGRRLEPSITLEAMTDAKLVWRGGGCQIYE